MAQTARARTRPTGASPTGRYAATAFLPLRAGFTGPGSSAGFGAVRNSTFPTTV